MKHKDISNSDDIIDSREVIARIKDLQGEREDLELAVNDAKEAHEAALDGAPDADYDLAATLSDAETELEEWDGEYADELKALEKLQEEAEGCSDWPHGATLIRESYFVDYCKDMVGDIGDLPKDIPSYLVIDWEATADNIKQDYTEVDFDGVAYYLR